MQKTWQILLVEDDEDDYIIAREMLSATRSARSEVVWARSYAEGKKALEEGLYDVVLMDYDLGDGTGIDLIRQAVERAYPSPIVLLTGRGTPEMDMEAMEAGASVYLNKNEVNGMLLDRTIRYAIEQKHVEAQLMARNEQLAQELAERQRVERALLESEKQMRLAQELLSKFPDPVIASDTGLGLIYWNQAAERTFGWKEAEAIGKDGRELLQIFPTASTPVTPLPQILEQGYFEGEVGYHHKDGGEVVLFTKAVILKGHDEEIIGLVASLSEQPVKSAKETSN